MQLLKLYKEEDGRTIFLKLDDMQKGKRAGIGEVRTGKDGIKRKKVAEGKWVPVTDSKDKKPEKTKDSKDKDKKTIPDKQKTQLRGIFKKIAEMLADAMSGKDTVTPAGQAIEQTGENIKRKKKIEPKNKD